MTRFKGKFVMKPREQNPRLAPTHRDGRDRDGRVSLRGYLPNVHRSGSLEKPGDQNQPGHQRSPETGRRDENVSEKKDFIGNLRIGGFGLSAASGLARSRCFRQRAFCAAGLESPRRRTTFSPRLEPGFDRDQMSARRRRSVRTTCWRTIQAGFSTSSPAPGSIT